MNNEFMCDITDDKKTVLYKTAENMIRLRPRKDVVLRPFIKPADFISNSYAGGTLKFDFAKIYKNACEGDYIFFKTRIYTEERHEAAVCAGGKCEVYFKGEHILSTNDEKLSVKNVNITEDESELLIKVFCTKNDFKMSLAISPPPLPGAWSNDYLMWHRITSPLPEYNYEDGFILSPLFKKGDEPVWNDENYIFPPKEKRDDIVDFAEIYGVHEGKYAIAYTNCIADGNFKINGSDNEIYVDGEKRENETFVKKGSSIVIVSKCTNSHWGFESLSNGIIRPQNIETRRKFAHWLLLGYFDDDNAKDNINFYEPYDSCSGKTFWKLNDKDIYIRPYLDTCFFGQWFYALMVGDYGLLDVSKILGKKYTDYFIGSISILAQYYDYMQYEKTIFCAPAFLSKSWYLDNLDSIGSIGMNLCELYKIRKDDKTLKLIHTLMKALEENIPRFEDGTFYRHPVCSYDGTKKHVMWSDDTYMSCPFLVRYAELTGDEKYYYEAANQLIGFYKRLYMKDKGILSHVYFVDEKKQSKVAWGRGNGWFFYTVADVLDRLPKNFKSKDELLRIYYSLLDGVIKYMGKNGMWHQVMDDDTSYEETSCTAMFIAGISAGVKNGWIDDKYIMYAQKAYIAMLEKSVGADGCIYGTCKGSGCHCDPNYYKNLGTVDNDDHGTGIVLTSICMLIKAEEKIKQNHKETLLVYQNKIG